ncbi:trypsin-like peptidase domain-containing protein [Pseudorhodoferax sp.]|uniref:trypsin-like peptidase domain-containing protein n=1 Tax=Pseudorhodoferax sp. TaxID=1993553 RepID=UPI002DD642E2|nr:trypsin-like peptidase domain-containing protein [Pseudorhodoferax sp.]
MAPSRGETLRERSGASPTARKLVLGSPSSREAAKSAAASGTLAPRRVGFARPVASAADAQATTAQLQWTTLPNGRQAAALSVTSPQAQGLRLGLLVRKLPAAATLRFYAQGSTQAHEIAAADVLDLLQHNRASGLTGDEADTYWSPLVEGSEATLEIELPAHVAANEVAVALPRLSHLDTLPSSDTAARDTVQPKIGEADACQIDVSCRPDYQNESRSVARLLFVKDGNSYLCSGALLKDKGASGTPYLLTAAHCIATQASASSLQTFWFYRSSSCNAEVLSAESRTLTGGATLLYASATTDTSFMRLSSPPPAGAVFADWSADPPVVQDAVFGLHHPRGDLQKISIGSVSSYERCEPAQHDPTTLACAGSDRAASQFVNVRYTLGSAEPGSSGSPLFRRVNGTSYVTGQLYGGSASCQDRSGTNIYGRFDIAYTAALQAWLDGPATRGPVYRFYNLSTGAHFYTMNTAERDYVIASYPSFLYEGPNFYAYNTQAEGTSPVFRFYNLTTGAHFFTINEAERDYVRATYPNFMYEGVGWYAKTTAQPGVTPLFRFYKLSNSTHFYTANADERAYVIQTQPTFVDEGIGYYVWPSL